jgi:hypothetical protein
LDFGVRSRLIYCGRVNSYISPDVIVENQSATWVALVAGSSKSDLAVFVCSIAQTQAGGENQIIQTEDLLTTTPVSPE